ncbi:alkaline phosphatase [Limnohabitans sp. Bal53]|nr:alkaline phosphatase [Limnohabitans sp. Bal53]
MKRIHLFIPSALAAACMQAFIPAHAQAQTQNFNRIATFESFRNVSAGRTVSKKSVAEIVAASQDGRLLAYTDGEQKGIGLIDITEPDTPKAAGFIPVEGEPTSVVFLDRKIVAAVDASKLFFQPEGHLVTIDIATRKVVESCNLQGQPDSIALDKLGRNIVVVLENQRDEGLNKGALPQLPAGNVTILPIKNGVPDCTGAHPINLTGLADIAPTDPEPEFVKVNDKGLAVVSLQENNHLVLIDVAKRTVFRHFSAGSVNLNQIDRKRDGVISPTESITGLLREPDAVAWLDDKRFVTANEGDYKGGSRGFSIINTEGKVEFDSGAFLDHLAIRLGHYPERRSGAKGNEPESAEVGVFGKDRLIFIGSERSSLISVWLDMGPGKAPQFLQALPAGAGPEGLLAIPQRHLLVVASETDGAARASVSIYQRSNAPANYPTLMSKDTPEGTPMAWGAISGTSADIQQPGRLWAVTDSAYSTTRILQIDANATPALITKEITLTKGAKPASYDAEGISQRADGSFWIASEGDPNKKSGPTKNLLLRVSNQGNVEEEIELPGSLNNHTVRFGFEGVTRTGSGAEEVVWIAVQREWKNDPSGFAKILRYSPAQKTWGVLHYPLSKSAAAGGWVGLSEITALSPNELVVIERDNQFGDQSFKTLHSFSVAGLVPADVGAQQVPVISKRLVSDLVPELQKPRGIVLDKVESFAIDAAGNAFFITDNDGVDGTNGETQFIRLGKLSNLR